MSGNVWNYLFGSSMVDMGILSNNVKFPSPKCYMPFLGMIIYRDPFDRLDFTPTRDLVTELYFITEFELFTKFRELSMNQTNHPISSNSHPSEYGTFTRHANRRRFLLRAPGRVPYWGLHVFCCWYQYVLNLSCLRTLIFQHPLVSNFA